MVSVVFLKSIKLLYSLPATFRNFIIITTPKRQIWTILIWYWLKSKCGCCESRTCQEGIKELKRNFLELREIFIKFEKSTSLTSEVEIVLWFRQFIDLHQFFLLSKKEFPTHKDPINYNIKLKRHTSTFPYKGKEISVKFFRYHR